MGGHIINASPVQLNFQDGSGGQLQPSKLIAGETPDGKQLTRFSVADVPLPPVPTMWWDPTPEEQKAISDFLEGVYFTAGRPFSYTAPVINGIAPTPASFNGQLTGGLNNINFTYATSSADNPENPISGGATSGGTTSSGLADTGVDVGLFVGAGAVAMLISVTVLIRKRL